MAPQTTPLEATITLNVSGSAPAPQALSVTLSFEEGSENMTVGQRIKLTANATGGDGSYQYSWDGGGTYVDASTWSYELVDGDAGKESLEPLGDRPGWQRRHCYKQLHYDFCDQSQQPLP